MTRKKRESNPIEIQSPPALKEDIIHAGNIGEEAVVVQGRGAKAFVVKLGEVNIDLRLLPVVIFLLAAIAGMAYYFVFMPKHPPRMTGRFNIAVAQFGLEDANGKALGGQDGLKLADFVDQRLNENFVGLDRTLDFQIWPPEYTGAVPGKDKTDRAFAAQKLAEKINAHILIYGVIQQGPDGGSFSPEFYVSYKGFDTAQEITGRTELGDNLYISLPVDLKQQAGVENPALAARTQALSLITLGLAYYSIDNFDQALQFFGKARDTQNWTKNAGKEIAYLLLGNARVRQASKLHNPAEVPQAVQDYTTALNIRANFARAKVGLASAVYLQAFKDSNNITKDTIDLPMLDQSSHLFQEAITLTDHTGQTSIGMKAHFGMGQVYQARATASSDASWLEKARAEYAMVMHDYERGDTLVGDLAGHSHANLGLMDAAVRDYGHAISEYTEAVALVSPHYQAVYSASLGELYIQAKQTALAVKSYRKAISLADTLGEDDLIDAYTKRLQVITGGP